MLKKKGFTLENKNISLLRRSNRWGWTALSIALCMLLSPLLAVSVFIPQGMTLVPIALLLLVGYVGPVSAATCTAILVTLSTVFFGFWGAALSAVLLVPILVVSSYMVEHEQSFWQSAAGSGVTMFASIGLAMLLVSALAGADVVTALSNMMRQAFSVSQTFSDMVLTMMMQLGAITSASGGAVDIATLDAAARGQLIEQLVLILDTLMRLEIPMQMATGSVAAGVLGQVALRKGVLSRGDKVDYPPLRTWTVPKGWGRVLGATLAASNIYIDDTSGITPSQLRSRCRRLKMEHGLDMIMVDYLQLMSADGHVENRQNEVSEISRNLKSIAKELNVPLVALAQLSRAGAQRSDKRPILSDLRDSGAIEQDADVIMFLHREEYYDPNTEDKNIAEVIVAKQRNGPLGTVKLAWLGQYTRFASLQQGGAAQ